MGTSLKTPTEHCMVTSLADGHFNNGPAGVHGLRRRVPADFPSRQFRLPGSRAAFCCLALAAK
ncbi:hypothetical protein D3C85_1860910 [compost metagenome]